VDTVVLAISIIVRMDKEAYMAKYTQKGAEGVKEQMWA
jgi:hypothetical protein